MADSEVTLPDGWRHVSVRTLIKGWYALWIVNGVQHIEGPYSSRREAERALDADRHSLREKPYVFEKLGDGPFTAVQSSLRRCHDCGSLVPRD